jgi:predicted alpha/beta hydrolase family esterase
MVEGQREGRTGAAWRASVSRCATRSRTCYITAVLGQAVSARWAVEAQREMQGFILIGASGA